MRIELIWPILTLVVALLLFLSEAFIPSGGLIGLMAIGFLGVSLYLAFTTTAYGWAFLLVTGLLLPITILAAISLWPRTPIGKMLTLNPPDSDAPPDFDDPRLDPLVGQYGRCLTTLRPIGLIDFDGRKLEGSAEEGMLPAGTLVRVVQVRGNRVLVRKAEIPAFDESTS
jgi:membrane-bound ClpP family serine protease